VRHSDDLQTMVRNIAKFWDWNSCFTKLPMILRKGHTWPDGATFTSVDVQFRLTNSREETGARIAVTFSTVVIRASRLAHRRRFYSPP
jgi:ABC-type transport system substrate-binding protein